MGNKPLKKADDNLSNHSDKSLKTFEKDVINIAEEIQKDLAKIKSKRKNNWIVYPTKTFFITIIFLLIFGMFFTQYFWFWINSLDIFQSFSILPERKFLLDSCGTRGLFSCKADVFGNELLLSIESGSFALQNATLSACQGYILKSNNLIKLYGCYISPYSNNFDVDVIYLNTRSGLSHNVKVNVIKQREISWVFNLLPDKYEQS